MIKPHQIAQFLPPLPVRKIPGVGKVTERQLSEMNIITVGDLQHFTVEQLTERFGKWGTRLYELARGIDESPVVASQKRKSWSSENTFERDITLDEVATWIRKASADLWESLDKKAMRGRTVTVKLRTPDFHTATRRLTPETPPSSADELAAIAVDLLQRFAFGNDAKYRNNRDISPRWRSPARRSRHRSQRRYLDCNRKERGNHRVEFCPAYSEKEWNPNRKVADNRGAA